MQECLSCVKLRSERKEDSAEIWKNDIVKSGYSSRSCAKWRLFPAAFCDCFHFFPSAGVAIPVNSFSTLFLCIRFTDAEGKGEWSPPFNTPQEASRSVAVMVRCPSLASKSKLERMGMVVLRSMTPCVMFSSFRNSERFTLNSIAWFSSRACAGVGMRLRRYFTRFLKKYKDRSSSRSCGNVEKPGGRCRSAF